MSRSGEEKEMFYETTGLEIIDSLESKWLVIKEELTRLQQKDFIS